MSDKYLLRVTCGPSYDPSTHTLVSVNTSQPTTIRSAACTVSLTVHIQNYHGLPAHSPTSSPYFHHPAHVHDQYALSFRITPHATVAGDALVFGNDFDHPIRDRLPPGFGTALRIVKWAVDPGLDGDVMADRPFLYGKALSSWNVFRVGEKGGKGAEVVPGTLEEGGVGDGVEVRSRGGVPDDAAGRRKWFLDEHRRRDWRFEEGREYWVDFGNGFIDFNGRCFALRAVAWGGGGGGGG